jgi:hypothetical protein
MFPIWYRFQITSALSILSPAHGHAWMISRRAIADLGLRSMFANPPLAEAALYVCII